MKNPARIITGADKRTEMEFVDLGLPDRVAPPRGRHYHVIETCGV